MDESYTHKNYCRYDGSLFDPNNTQLLEAKYQHKGNYYYLFKLTLMKTHRKMPLLTGQLIKTPKHT